MKIKSPKYFCKEKIVGSKKTLVKARLISIVSKPIKVVVVVVVVVIVVVVCVKNNPCPQNFTLKVLYPKIFAWSISG